MKWFRDLPWEAKILAIAFLLSVSCMLFLRPLATFSIDSRHLSLCITAAVVAFLAVHYYVEHDRKKRRKQLDSFAKSMHYDKFAIMVKDFEKSKDLSAFGVIFVMLPVNTACTLKYPVIWDNKFVYSHFENSTYELPELSKEKIEELNRLCKTFELGFVIVDHDTTNNRMVEFFNNTIYAHSTLCETYSAKKVFMFSVHKWYEKSWNDIRDEYIKLN